MEPHKASGPYGFYYGVFSGLLGYSSAWFSRAFPRTSFEWEDIRNLNATFITLIPKKVEATYIQDLDPSATFLPLINHS